MTPDWTPLDTELSLWAESGLSLPLWWRDDDAIAPTPALNRLSELSAKLNLPVHLAIIPSLCETELPKTVTACPHLIPVVHGWAHANHAPPEEKKAEFGAHRPLPKMQRSATRAFELMSNLFGADLCPIFVPPWNRIDPQLLPQLPMLGYTALSTFTPRRAVYAAPGLSQINTHVDPINWRGGCVLADQDTLINKVALQLEDRRKGQADNAEPYGILSHHLVHDEAVWDFTEQLLTRLLAGPSYRWCFLKQGTSHEST